jgi:hypothetical protein
MLVSLGEDGEQEATGLSRTSLGASHEIATAHNNGDRVFLDRGWDLVSRELDVHKEMVIQGWVGEGGDGLGDVLAGSLHRDIVVLFEVDAGMLLGRIVGNAKELTLDTRIGGTGNVLAIPPLSVARSTCRGVGRS